MLVRAKEACFIGGYRHRQGEVFEYEGKPARYLVPVEEEVATATSSEVEIAGKKGTVTGRTLKDHSVI